MRIRLILYAALLLSLLPAALPGQTSTAPATTAAAVLPPAILPFDQIKTQADLDRTVTALDAAMFDSYNRCDLAKFNSFFTEDVEFYHDKGGLTRGNAALTDSIRKNICGKVTRELVPGTLKAFHMDGYGALETATHRFHHTGEVNDQLGEAETVMLWQYKDGAWKITRVISYDHHTAAN